MCRPNVTIHVLVCQGVSGVAAPSSKKSLEAIGGATGHAVDVDGVSDAMPFLSKVANGMSRGVLFKPK